MHVTIVGPAVGRPAVALHGLGGSTEQNLPALEAVATCYGLRIHAIDLPNHGRSGKVRILHFQVRHFADLILEAIRALEIEPVVIFGHSFGGQLAALVAEGMGTGALQPVFVNPALGTPWDLKLRLCWRRPWLFFKLIEELGYDDANIAKGELYHAGRLLLFHGGYALRPQPATLPATPGHDGFVAEPRHSRHSQPPDEPRHPADRCPGDTRPIHAGRGRRPVRGRFP